LVCRGEAGAYARFAKEHPEVAFLGLNAADTPERAREFVQKYGWTWPSISDPERRVAKSIGADYQPFVALFDENGVRVAVHDGGGEEADWRALLARLG
jgi:peroxiredoxin